MLLLSMLVIAVAAMPAMALSGDVTFKWTGSQSNVWENANNWSPSISFASLDVSFAGRISNTEYYPGNNKMNYSADVVISKDARITVNQGLIRVTGISIDKAAKVSIDLGGYGYFTGVPDIEVISGDFELSGTRALTIDRAATWKGSYPMTLNLLVNALSNRLTLSVDNAALTINNASLLGNTDIRVAGKDGKLVLNVSPERSTTVSDATSLTATNAPRRGLVLNFVNDAKLEVPSGISVTLDANRNRLTRGSVVRGKLIKTGAGTLTLHRVNAGSYDVVVSPDVAKVAVNAGTLVFTGTRPLSTDVNTILNLDVASGANLVVSASNAVYTTNSVRLTVSGDASVNAYGIGTATGLYASNILNLTNFNVSADVRSGGTLTFKGNQPVKAIKGKGTVVASSGMLMLDGTSKDIADFTGTLQASIVGLTKSFDDLPFAEASADISSVYVYGDAELMLDADKLASVSGLDQLGVYLRSNHYAVSGSYLSSNTVAVLKVSGDIAIGTLSADGSKNVPAVVVICGSQDQFTVNKLVLHANKVGDSTTTPDDSSQPTYSGVHAILLSGDGVFVPNAISNASTAGGLGSERAIEVRGATLKLNTNVDIPASNSLMLNGGKLEAANGVTIPVDFTIQSSDKPNYIKVAVTAANGSGVGSSGNSALNVNGNLSLNGTISIDMTLEDVGRFLGKRYKLVGPSTNVAFNKVVSNDVDLEVVGTYNDVMHVSYDIMGIYGILEKLIQVPQLGSEWRVEGDPKTFGSGESEFVARLSYDLPVDVTPAGLINLIVVSIDIENQTFSNKGTTRKLVQANGKDIVYISSLEVNSADKEIVLTGTSYVTKLDTEVALSWSKVSKDWVPYENAGMYYGSRKIESQDFRQLDYQDRAITNPIADEDEPAEPGTLSEDVTADPEDVALTPEVHTVVAGSDDVVLTVTGIRRLLTGSNGFVPVLVNGNYVWMNGYDPATEKFEMLYGGNWMPVSLDITINGVSVNMASVDISGSEPVTVTIPAELFTTDLAYTAPQEVKIVGTTENGHTITTEPISVWVKPASGYETGTIDPGYVASGRNNTAVTRQVADIPLDGTISFDVTSGNMPDEWIDFDGVAAGVISFTVPAGTAAGVYTKTLDVYTAEGGYTYTFSYEVIAGLAITGETVFDNTYGGLNYEAHYTANAPVASWDLTGNPDWLKSARSGDVFVVYGQLPAYVPEPDNVPEDYVDPNEVTYTVTAAANGETASLEESITIEEDTDETVPPAQFSAGSISGDVSSADTNYSVVIAFNADNYDSELTFLSLPYWLKATPVMGTNADGDEVITGYTLTYKTGTAVTAGESGVVRFEDPESGNIVSWPVTFNQTVAPQPVPGSEFGYSVTGSTTVSVALAARDTSITITPRNVLGTVSYTSSASWVTVDDSTGVVAITPTDAALVSETPHTVTITLTDSGRTESNTLTVELTITVTSGGFTPTPGSEDQPVPGSEFMYSVTGSTTVSVALAARDTSITITPRNVLGTVSYTSSASWVTVNSSTGVVAINPTDSSLVSATPHTVTITLTDSGRTTANTQTVTLTITVTSGGVTPETLRLSVSPSPLNITLGNIGTVRLSASNVLGTATYSMSAPDEVGGILSGDTAVFIPDEAGTHTVTFTVVDSGRTTGNSATAALTVNVTLPSSSVGSSGGGCDAGFGALALALALPLFLRRRRS